MTNVKLDRRVKRALLDASAILVNSKKHLVYKFPNGKTIILSQQNKGNCEWAFKHQLEDIKRISNA